MSSFLVALGHHQTSTFPAGVKQQVKAIVLKVLDQHGATSVYMKIAKFGDMRVIEVGGPNWCI